MTITWANHHRILQADALVAWTDAGTGAEAGEHRALQVRDSGGVLLAEKLDIATDAETATVETDYTGTVHFKLWSIRDGFDSWQAVEWTSEHPVGDAVAGTVITAGTWFPPPSMPDQPHGEALVADDILPLEQLTNEDETDFLFSD